MPRALTAREPPAILRSEHGWRGEATPVGSVLPHKLFSFVSYSAASDDEHDYASAEFVNLNFQLWCNNSYLSLWTISDDIIVVALSRAYVYVIGPNGLIECPLGNSTDDRAYAELIMLSAKSDGERD